MKVAIAFLLVVFISAFAAAQKDNAPNKGYKPPKNDDSQIHVQSRFDWDGVKEGLGGVVHGVGEAVSGAGAAVQSAGNVVKAIVE